MNDADIVRHTARDAIEWLDSYAAGDFDIRCQRCYAPFQDGLHAVAAPPEWFGVLSENRDLAETVLALLARAEQAERERDTLRKALERAPAMGLAVEEYERWYVEDCYPALAAVSPPQEGEA